MSSSCAFTQVASEWKPATCYRRNSHLVGATVSVEHVVGTHIQEPNHYFGRLFPEEVSEAFPVNAKQQLMLFIKKFAIIKMAMQR